MARRMKASRPAKRANRPNPREDRSQLSDDTAPDFLNRKKRRSSHDAGATQPETATFRSKKAEPTPRNLAQEEYLEALNDERNSVVFGIGPAGCGKTYLAVVWAVQQLQAGLVEKIIIARPVTTADGSNMGALPGGILEKYAPYLGAILDALKEFYAPRVLAKMMEDEVVQIIPLAIMRGRTFKHAIVLGDEFQDTTTHVAKCFLTRLGEGAKMVITGDLAQADHGYMVQNGLKDFVERLEASGGSEYFEVCRFGREDIERHPAVAECLRIYGEED